MNRRKATKTDDLDDILEDLLGDNNDPPPKKTSTSGRSTGARKKGRDTEEDFYSSLAAEADESDVSEADVGALAKSLSGLDDMDDMLFGGSSKRPKSAGAEVNTTKSTTKGKKSVIDFDDDDPLAGLLSDDDSKPKKKAPAAQKSPAISQKEVERPRTGPKDDEDDLNSASSRRLEIDRPPTRSGSRAEAKKANDNLFDDDSDVLGGVGLDDSPKQTKKTVKKTDDDDTGKGAGILDDLLGTSSASKHLQRPGTSEKREFVLDKKYMKGGSGAGSTAKKEKELEEEDFTFGGYNPSAATSRPGSSRPTSRRSVRFEDDDLFDDKPRAGSAPAGGRRGRGAASSFLEDMITKDDTDWLDMASGTKSEKKEERPKSAGSILEKPSEQKGSTSEAVDWLGLSRLGSPAEKRDEAKPPDDKSSGSTPKNESEKVSTDTDDWLGLGSSSKSHRSRSPTKSTQDADDDWLGLATGSRRSRKDSQSSSRSPDRPKENKSDDWLGLGKEEKEDTSDDWLSATFKSKKERKSSATGDDWLGMNDTKSSKADSTDYLGLGDDVDPDTLISKSSPQKSRADERGLDLFSTPARRESASLPWDSDLPRGRRGRPPAASEDSDSKRPARSPEKTVSSERKDLGKPKSPDVDKAFRRSSPADSIRGLSADEQTKDKEEQRIKKQEPKGQPAAKSTTDSLQLGVTAGLDMDTTSMFLQQQRQQEEYMRQQQQKMIEQQQQQQAEIQKRMMEQQELARKQQEQQMKAMLEAQQQMMQGQFASPVAMPQMRMPVGMSGFGIPSMTDMSGLQVQRLELEKKHLEMMIETLKKQHEEELKMLDESFKKRMELLEETSSKRESRLREENQVLSEQNMATLKMVEQEKADLVSAHTKRQEEWQNEKQNEIEKLREFHRQEINALRNEHDETLERLKKAREHEVDAIAHTQSHTRNLQAVVSQLSDNARELGDLQAKVETKHSSSLDERETAAKARDEQLKTLQERLEGQQHDNELERARLQGLISKLETQLTEQTRSIEEDKWRLRQEETRLQTAQSNLSKEKDMMLDHIKRERADVQRAKEQLLEEQKSILGQLYEERRALADERAQFSLNQKLKMEQDQRESLKTIRNAADIESSVKAINDEKARMTKIALELQHGKEKLEAEKAVIEQQKLSMQLEKEKLEQVALQVKQRSKDIEEMVMEAARAREEGERALADSKRLEMDQGTRLSSIQGQLQALRAKEKQIAQERVALARERQQFEQNRHSVLCVSCRTPIKETQQSQDFHTPVANTPGKMTPAAANLYSALDPDLQNKVTSSIDHIAKSIDVDRSVRTWRIQAEKDKDFLQEESYFLEALKHTPYHENPSSSKS